MSSTPGVSDDEGCFKCGLTIGFICGLFAAMFVTLAGMLARSI